MIGLKVTIKIKPKPWLSSSSFLCSVQGVMVSVHCIFVYLSRNEIRYEFVVLNERLTLNVT